MRLVIVVVLLLLCLSVSASDLSLRAEKLQISGIGGTIGIGGAAYWPLVSSTQYEVSLGPLLALGTEAVAFGGGMNIGIDLDFPILHSINFGWGGYGSNWAQNSLGWEYGVGQSSVVK